jgi:putative transposase
MEVKIKPFYGNYVIVLTYQSDTVINSSSSFQPVYEGAIDLGVNNLAALVSNDGNEPLLYKGEVLKSRNQWYNKQKAMHISCLTKGHDPKTVCKDSKLLRRLSRYRADFIRDYLHKVSSHIVKICLKRNIGILYIGKNDQWKTKANMSKASNQEFVSIPHSTLIWMIRYKAERYGISVIEQEESYTSKASFLDDDALPVYGENDEEHHFSGRRISRGLYRTKNGTILNADINGSANILRKASPNAFEGITDYRFLQKVKTVPFRALYPSGTVSV